MPTGKPKKGKTAPIDPRREPEPPLHEETLTWTVQKTVNASSLEELERKRDAITNQLSLEFDTVDLHNDVEIPDEDDDDDRDLDDGPDGELDFEED